jgi:hypothetical protein
MPRSAHIPLFSAGALVAAAVALFVATPALAARAYVGKVAGAATGPGHNFVEGDGLNLLFTSRHHSNVGYRVCWSRGHGSKCWHSRTAVAHWRFFNSLGD